MTNNLNAFTQEWLTFTLLLSAQVLLVLALRARRLGWIG